jgi:heme A synthase
MSPNRVASGAWVVVAYTVAVILWGSVVRATGSGAGCGGHWPTCDGSVLIVPTSTAMWFELVHRLSSGFLILLVAALTVSVYRATPVRHMARRMAAVSSSILVVEALLGAGLVLFGLVADNQSASRAAVVAVHLTNTLALLAFLTLTAWSVRHARPVRRVLSPAQAARPYGPALALALAGVVAIGATGAITALGDTLFPAETLTQGLRSDASPTAHFLVRMRVLHPVLAMAVGVYVLMLAGSMGRALPRIGRVAALVSTAVIVQTSVGFANLLLLAPVALQVLHLLVADLLWISLVVLSASYWIEVSPAEADGSAVRTGANGDAVTLGGAPA